MSERHNLTQSIDLARPIDLRRSERFVDGQSIAQAEEKTPETSGLGGGDQAALKCFRLAVLIVELNNWEGAARLANTVIDSCQHRRVHVVVVVDPASPPTDESNIRNALRSGGTHVPCTIVRGPASGLATNWNFGIGVSAADYVVRLDAHGEIEADFVDAALRAISDLESTLSGSLVVGGPVELAVAPSARHSARAQAIRQVEASVLFSGGMGPHKKRATGPKMATYSSRALYPSELVAEFGGFRDTPFACEDSEMSYRLVNAGYRYLLLPSLLTRHYTRRTVREFARQRFRNGAANGYLASLGRPVSMRKLVPSFALGVAALFGGSRRARSSRSLMLVATLYSSFVLYVCREPSGVDAAENSTNSVNLRARAWTPIVAAAGHVSHAVGGFVGAARGLLGVVADIDDAPAYAASRSRAG